MIEFTNSDVSIDSIPRVEPLFFNPLNIKYRNVLIIKATLFSLILIIAYYFTFFIQKVSDNTYLKLSVLALILIIVFINLFVSYFGFKKKKYKLRQHDLIYKTGIWWTSETSIPFVRVQHSEVIQGPIERLFGLAKLKLYTAGGQTSDLSVPGLSPETAHKLKDFITNRLEEEEE